MDSGKHPHARKSFKTASYAFAAVGAISTALVVSRAAIALFGPGVAYRFSKVPEWPLDSDDFQRYLSIITDSAIQPNTSIEVLTNGEVFYPVEFDAISRATANVHIEAYEFFEGRVTRELLELLTERARHGVAVRLVIDALGSFSTHDSYFVELRRAGGEVCWYHPLRLGSWPSANNRTHRKILIVDGTTAFVGGADYADHWLYATKEGPRWRDTVFKIEGEAVAAVQSAFAENWLESSGYILADRKQFPTKSAAGSSALVVNSSPGGGATRSRMLFQTLLETAKSSIHITSPYFLPDHSAHAAMSRAMRRGVEIKVITAGAHNDHPSIGR